MFAPILVCFVIELALRLGDWGYPPSAVSSCRVDGRPYFCDNPKFTWRFFPPRLARVGEPFAFPAEKSDETYRIFILGASAALGTPDSAYGFGRILNVMLAEAYPEVRFEVINTAITAINSHVVVEIARDCARHRPDLFMVYLGNNEVVGPYGPGTIFGARATALPLIRLSIRLKATRLGQLLTAATAKLAPREEQPVAWTGMAMFLENQVRSTDPRMPRVYDHFRVNLETIRDIATDSGAAVMFCTVGSNVKDCPPFASLHGPGLTKDASDRWRQAYERGVGCEQVSQWQQAVQWYLAAERIDDAFAELHFRLARCFLALGEYGNARARFARARELDTLRFRPDRRINQIIRKVAGDPAPGVYLVDAVDAFEKNSPHNCPGSELFHEHVHLNFTGNYLLAKTIFERIKTILPAPLAGPGEAVASPLSEVACAQRLAYTAWDRYTVTQKVLNDFVSQPPFTNQAYHSEWTERLEQALARQRADLTQRALDEAKQQYQEVIGRDPNDWHLHYKYAGFLSEGMKDPAAAAEQFRVVVQCVPHYFKAHAALGIELLCLGRYEESIRHNLKAVELMPTYGVAYNNLGTAYVRLNELEKAKASFGRAVHWSGRNLPAYNGLIDILVHEGNLEDAVTVCRRALRFVPEDALLHCKLGTLLGMQGKRAEALEEIRTAARLDPNSPEIRDVLHAVSGP